MTYLAAEMLLYLLSAAMIGLVLGWLIWGAGQRRKINTLRADLVSTIEAEKEEHDKTKVLLERADTKMIKAVEEAKADANRSLEELRQTVDTERQVAQEAQSALQRMRTDLEEAIRAGKASGLEAVDQAMQVAEVEKAAAANAMAKEAQSRAEIEELRLLVGAEKLAAQTARAELAQMRSDMQAALEAERVAHGQAKTALADIRSTLARTFGTDDADASIDAEAGAEMGPAAGQTATSGPLFAHAFSESDKGPDRSDGLSDAAAGADGLDAASSRMNAPLDITPSQLNMMTDIAAADEALNNPDLDEADIEDREDMKLDLSSTIERDSTIEVVDSEQPQVLDRIELRPLPAEPKTSVRPSDLFDQRPDKVDDLRAIDSIGPELERRLHEAGCYQYRQLAAFTPMEMYWLALEIDVTDDRIVTEGWAHQAKQLLLKTDIAGDDRVSADNAAGQQNSVS